jgi:transposase InsO family protein
MTGSVQACSRHVWQFATDTAPKWLLRDRDAIYSDTFRRRVAGIGIGEVISSPSSPWQNPYAERLIGSIRRECLDHVVVLSERHLRRVLAAYAYIAYYHESRTHLGLEKDTPNRRSVQPPSAGGLSLSPKSAVCTTGTSGAPHEPRIDQSSVPGRRIAITRASGHHPI